MDKLLEFMSCSGFSDTMENTLDAGYSNHRELQKRNGHGGHT